MTFMIIKYVVYFLVAWILLGFAFTMLLWPKIADKIDRDYPEA